MITGYADKFSVGQSRPALGRHHHGIHADHDGVKNPAEGIRELAR